MIVAALRNRVPRLPRSLALGFFLALAACKPQAGAPAVEPAADAAAPELSAEEKELQARLAWLEAQLEQARVDTHVPGMAIAIVKDDEILWAKGFGVSDLEANTPVTPETTFAIGSATKAFSSALVAIMADEGKLDFDDPASKYLPGFKLALDSDDPQDEPTIRDLLSHRAGFARMGLLWAGGTLTRERMLAYASKAEPVAKFRDEFHYNNVTYMAGALTAARAAGVTWEELLQTRLLDPLGMEHTNFDHASAQKDPQWSKGYTWRDDLQEHELEPMRNIDVIGPAGSINSSVLDMTRWLRMQLAYGSFEGKEIVSKKNLRKTRSGVIKVGGGIEYGMGWMLQEWGEEDDEKKVVEHGGNIDGFAASVAFMPEEGLGMVLLTNASMTPLQQMGHTLVWDALLTDAYKEDPNPTNEDFSKFTGKYVPDIPGFEGELFEVSVRGGKLAIDVPGQTVYSLKPPDDDEYRYFDATDQIAASFAKDENGEVIALVMHQGGMDMEFYREGYTPPVEVNEAEVAELLGHYESEEGLSGDVIVKNGRLAFDIQNQLAFALEKPEADGEYHFRANYEMFVVFDRDAKKKDKVVGLTFFADGKATKFARKKGLKTPSLEEVHKKRRTEKRKAAFDKAGIVRIDQKIEVLSSGVVGEATMWFDARGELRNEQKFGELGEGITVLHDGKAWAESVFEPLRALDGILLVQAQANHPAIVYADWRTAYPEETVMRSRKTDDGLRWLLKVRRDGYPAITLHLDAKTGDIVEIRGFEVAPNGMRVPTKTKLMDYKTVKGMRIPHVVEISNGQTGTVRATVTSIETQRPADEARFVDMPAK